MTTGSFPPIPQQSISFSFIVGESLRVFIEGHDKDVNSFNKRYRDTVSIENDRIISSLRQRLLRLFVALESRAGRSFYALSHEHNQPKHFSHRAAITIVGSQPLGGLSVTPTECASSRTPAKFRRPANPDQCVVGTI